MREPKLLRPEQLYVFARNPDTDAGFVFSDSSVVRIPWHRLGGCHLFSLTVEDLEAALNDAVALGYSILSGSYSERRGLRAFQVGLGAWGWRGRVEVRTVESWAVEVPGTTSASDVVVCQMALRSLCIRLNAEPVPFASSSTRWLSALVRRLSHPLEPDGHPSSLPEDVAVLCRRAHVGGPIVHARTTLQPFVSIDRSRAYGEAMLGLLPVGNPAEVNVPKDGAPVRWRERDLMASAGVADAVVHVEPGPFVPLLPLFRPHKRYDRSVTFYPTGSFRSVFVLEELAALERSGRGRVERLHRVVTFEQRPVLAGVVKLLRAIEPDLVGIKVKRLEHVLYGRCSRTLSFTRIASVPSGRRPVARDLLDDRSAGRTAGRMRLSKVPSAPEGSSQSLWKLSGTLSPATEQGSTDRPERSAIVTARNRMAMWDLIQDLDCRLKPDRGGSFVGRIYVDGIDVQAPIDVLPPRDDLKIEASGVRLDIHRSTISCAFLHDGRIRMETGGLDTFGGGPDELRALLHEKPDPDGGPFAGGRLWPIRDDGFDSRDFPGVSSEPVHVDPSFASAFLSDSDAA